MTKERTSNERFEIVGLTKAEVDRCMEVLCGGPMPWDRGYCFASSELFARPSRYGPEPSNEGRKPMSDESRSTSKDLVARLRSVESRGERTIWTDAADEIERLRARIAELEKYKLAVEQHNRECDDLCNNAATCGYKQYFDANGRRCTTCPVDMKINVV